MRSPTSPAAPSPAATLVLIRDRLEGSPEVLLIQRHAASRFAAGDFVFPGGKVEAEDLPANADACCAGITDDQAKARLGDIGSARLALGHWIGAIREAFEEVGILMAYDREGRLVRLTGAEREKFAAYRRRCQEDGSVFWRMLREEHLTLATDRLIYFAHWITPEESPVRFDTRFFAAEAPAGQDAVADELEIVGIRWLTPAEGVEARRRGELPLRFPTVKNLGLLQGRSAAEVLAGLESRTVPAIRPRVLTVDGTPRVLLPTDPGWY
ncbi:MAG: hypothetical protein ACE5JD_03995 [Candidatus Methylomirabilia bacterium]